MPLSALDPSVDASGSAANRNRVRPSSAPVSRPDGTTGAASAGNRTSFVYTPSPSPVDPFIVRSKQFEFGTCTLNQIGIGGVPPPTAAAVTTSRMPIGYQQGLGCGGSTNGVGAPPTLQQSSLSANSTTHNIGHHIGSSSGSGKHAVARGPSHVQNSFYASNANAPQPSSARSPALDEAVEDQRKHALADRVAERLVHVQERRQSLQRRIRPTSHHPQLPVEGTGCGGGASYQVGFDGRSAILHAARSACLSSAPAAPTSARKNFYDVDLHAYGVAVAHPHDGTRPSSAGGRGSNGGATEEDTTLLLRHRRTELMLSDIPLVGAGLRALLLAAQENVHDVAGGVLTVAQILGHDVGAQRDLQAARREHHTEQHGGTVPTAMYKDGRGANNGGESWRIVYAAAAGGGGASPQRGHQRSSAGGDHRAAGADRDGACMSMAGTSLMPDGFENVLNGSAVRIRGRPHSAPLSRDDGQHGSEHRAQKKPMDYLAQMRAASTSASSKRRPMSAQPARPSSATMRQQSAIKMGPSAAPNTSMYVMDARDSTAKPAAPEWLGNCGLIGVSVDPRYQPSGQQGREGFGFFGSSSSGYGSGGAAAAGDGAPPAQQHGPSAADGHPSNSGLSHQYQHHHGHVVSFRGATALSTIREARVRRDAAALEHRKGMLRGGAGFLMFSASTSK